MANPTAYPLQSLGFVNVTTAGTPVQMSSTSLKVRGLSVAAFKAKGTANTGANIYVQDAQGHVLFTVPKGTTFPVPLSHPQLSQQIDLANLWIDADTSGDGLEVTALL
jgi:hypothetical protein